LAGETDVDLTQIHEYVSARLAERRSEFEAAARDRVDAVADPAGADDPTYAEGLRTAITAAFGYAMRGVEGDDGRTAEPVPVALLVQARVAARTGVSLDTVLRRYFAGYNLLLDFLMREAQDGGFSGAPLRHLVTGQAALFDRLLVSVTEEHSREWERPPGSSEERRVERVEALLSGESAERGELDYDFDSTHLGLVAGGAAAAAGLQDVARKAGCRVLLVQPDDRTAWAWLAVADVAAASRINQIAAESPAGLLVGLGEPAAGISGWRLTHRQARTSLSMAMRDSRHVVRYGDVAMLAAVVGDELASESLRRLFLAPLAQGRDGGAAIRNTLRAYFAADRNVTSAAAALAVSRQTVINRLQVVEERLGRPLSSCAVELETALRLDQFETRQEPTLMAGLVDRQTQYTSSS